MSDKLMKSMFVPASEQNIIDLVNSAQSAISFFGTGLSDNVAKAICSHRGFAGPIVLDNSEDAYQIGYGNVAAISLFKDAGIPFCKAPNIRINVLRIDDLALIYSPIPLRLEERKNGNNQGGILVDFSAVKSLFDSIVVKDETEPDGEQDNENPEIEKTAENEPVSILEKIKKPESVTPVVVSKVTEEEIKTTVETIEKNPPQLDLSRQLNVYTNKIQFVEIELRNFNLAQHTVKIPKELLKLSKNDKDIEEQLNATYTLVNKKSSMLLTKAESIQEEVKKLRTKFTVQLKGFGVVFAKKQKKDLEKTKGIIDAQIIQVKDSIKMDLEDAFAESKKNIVQILYPLLKRNPPVQLTRFFDADEVPSKEDIERYIMDKLDNAFDSPEKFTDGMSLKMTFKDVTIEMLRDKEFSKAVFSTDLKYLFRDEGYFSEQSAFGLKR